MKPAAKFDQATFLHAVGIDPGLKFMFGAVVKNRITQSFENLRLKSRKWTHDTKFKQFTRQKTKLTGAAVGALQFDLIDHDNIGIAHPDVKEFTKLQRRHFKSRVSVCMTKKMAKLRWKSEKERRKQLDLLAESIVPKDGKTIVFYGDGKFAPWISAKGCRKPPLAELHAALDRIQRAKVFLVDEFRTTALCCKCHRYMRTPKLPARDQRCPGCPLIIHRDNNAGHNMITVGEQNLSRKFQIPDWAFSRDTPYQMLQQ